MPRVNKTIMVKDVIRVLEQYNPDCRVYLSIDSEGNGFSTMNIPGSFDGGAEKTDGALILMPWEEGLQYEDIAPNMVKSWN